jgi:hypothetical protein
LLADPRFEKPRPVFAESYWTFSLIWVRGVTRAWHKRFIHPATGTFAETFSRFWRTMV